MTATAERDDVLTTGIAARSGAYLATLIGVGEREVWEVRSHPDNALLATYPAVGVDGFQVMRRFFQDQVDMCREKHQ